MGEHVKPIKSIEFELPEEMGHLERVLISLDNTNLWTERGRKNFPSLLIFDPDRIPHKIIGEFYNVDSGSVYLGSKEASHLRLRAKDKLYINCNEQMGMAVVYNNALYSKYFPNN